MNKFFILAGMAATLASCSINEATVTSPDGDLKLEFRNVGDELLYTLTAGVDTLVRPSQLGFVLSDSRFDRFTIEKVTKSSCDSVWETVWGESRFVRENYNGITLEMKAADGMKVNLEARAFDDGVGFRYVFPELADTMIIMSELTEFNVPVESTFWAMDVDDDHFEGYYVERSFNDVDSVTTPLTLKTPSHYMAIHEAALKDFPKMSIVEGKDTTSLRAGLMPLSTGEAAVITGEFATPWRFYIVGETPGDLVTSTVMLNLNDPCAIDDPSFCEPMKYIGVWWEMHLYVTTWYGGPHHAANTANVKRYIDFAADNGIPGVLVEGWNTGWEGHWPDNDHFDFTSPYADYDIDSLSRYAASRGVKLIGHHETAAWITNYENQLDTAFNYMTSRGINNIKTGYVNRLMDGRENHASQFGVRHFRKVIEEAARHGVNIDNHEPVMPTGISRTYPNLMTQEGVRGQEHSAWDADGGNPPYHTVIMPFTRGLAGPMDFTFGTFNYETPNSDARVKTTLAKELALYVIIYSPMQMASDLPENYAAHMDAFQFIKDVPVDWETTIVPQAEIGKYVVTVRQDRNSSDWYLGAATDDEARQLSVPLDFLDTDTEYVAQIYADAPDANWETNPTAYQITETTVTAEDVLPLNLAPGGGTAIRFIKK